LVALVASDPRRHAKEFSDLLGGRDARATIAPISGSWRYTSFIVAQVIRAASACAAGSRSKMLAGTAGAAASASSALMDPAAANAISSCRRANGTDTAGGAAWGETSSGIGPNGLETTAAHNSRPIGCGSSGVAVIQTFGPDGPRVPGVARSHGVAFMPGDPALIKGLARRASIAPISVTCWTLRYCPRRWSRPCPMGQSEASLARAGSPPLMALRGLNGAFATNPEPAAPKRAGDGAHRARPCSMQVAASRATMPITTARLPSIIGHRGGAFLWPENSLAAFSAALSLPMDEVECDVHPSADGVPMVIHDATLERTTDLAGPVALRTAAELGAARMRGAPSEAVPTLGALAALLRPSDKRLRVEIKTDAAGRPYPGLLGAVLSVLAAEEMLARSVLICFHGPTAAEAWARGGLAGAVWLVSGRVLATLGAPATVAAAQALGVPELDTDLSAMTPELLGAAREAGLRAGVWAANHRAEIERAFALGVDALATDDPPLALALRAAAFSRPATRD
jgi:glycerophosphoryl diester phosphodiesterase